MNALALKNDLRTYATSRWPSADNTFRKTRLANLLQFSERRVRSFWEGNAAAPRDEEIEAIEALIGKKEAAHDADRTLTARVARLEEQLAEVAALLADAEQRLERRKAGSEGESRRH